MAVPRKRYKAWVGPSQCSKYHGERTPATGHEAVLWGLVIPENINRIGQGKGGQDSLKKVIERKIRLNKLVFVQKKY